jgi:hypothetical protein
MQPSGSVALLLGGSLRLNRLVLGGMVVWLLLSATGAAAVAAASMSSAAALVSSALPSSRTTSLLLPTSCYAILNFEVPRCQKIVEITADFLFITVPKIKVSYLLDMLVGGV